MPKPSYNQQPAPVFYAPTLDDEDLILEEIMSRVLVRYGEDSERLQRVLSKLYAIYPVAFRGVVNRRIGRRVL